jgi:magnesium chelatase accessory protein
MLAIWDSRRLDFDREGRDWPHRDASLFLEAGSYRWHAQQMGSGPDLLLIHGTGASTHSWEALMPLLARRFRVTAVDLPGHGFTAARRPPDLTLPGMSRAFTSLLRTLALSPEVVVGHSAGAAILARLCLDGAIEPKLLVSLNGALLPFEGAARYIFPSFARLLFLNPFTPRLFAWSAGEASVGRLIAGTGSKIGRRGVDLYRRLLENPAHVAGALGMMANWDLAAIRPELKRLKPRVLLIVGWNDRTVPPTVSEAVAREIPGATVEPISQAGHLVHEEQPERVFSLIEAAAIKSGVLPQA